MTRFDASDPAERRTLFVDAIVAHRERASPFLTIEVDAAALEDDSHGTPWIQFADGVVNLDCTEAELESMKSLLATYPAFKIADLTRPDDAKGVNVRVSAKADPNRIAQFLEATFQEVYGLPAAYRAWVTAV